MSMPGYQEKARATSDGNYEHHDMVINFEGLAIQGAGKPKKKRAVRAYHIDSSSPSLNHNGGLTSGQTPNLGNGSPYFQSPAHFSPAMSHGQQASPYGQQNGFPGQQASPYGQQNGFPGQQASPYGQQNGFPGQQASPYGQQAEFPGGGGGGGGQFYQDSTIPQDMTHTNEVSQHLSVSEFRYLNQQEYMTPNPEDGRFKTFFTFNNVKPPDAATQFHSFDQGTASSKFIRSSLYHVPESENLRAATKLPISVTIRPFAPLLATEEPIPVVDMTRDDYPSEDALDNGPIRCRRCRAYVNPSMQFNNMGKFVCNICQFGNNIVPSDYNAMLDNQGQRIDKFVRPELHKGVYDLIVPKEYNFGGENCESKPINHVFLIDISEPSMKQNLPVVVADAIRKTLYSDDNIDQDFGTENENSIAKPQAKFAIIAFDKRIHFFNLSSKLESTQISICSDLQDPFVPFIDGLFADANESRNTIDEALSILESMTSADCIADSESAFAAACRSAMLCLESVGGGKITAVLAGLPSWGPGRLQFKDNRTVGRALNAEAEKRIFLPDNEYYKLLAKDFIEKGVGLDVHVVSHVSVDLSNIGWLSSITGGTTTRFPNFNFERDGRSLTARIFNSIKKVKGYQGQMKLRSSNGLQVSQYYGTYVPQGDNITSVVNIDPVIPILDEDLTITALLEYDGNLSTKLDCHFQAALLYTDIEGVRKVRVINLVLAVSERLEEVFDFADENAIVTTIVRDSLSFVGKQTLVELRESLNEKLVQIFTQYRAMSEGRCNGNRRLTNKLLFPDSLKHLPQFFLAFIKSRAIRNSNLTADERLEDMYQMLTMPVERLTYHLYPALVELHNLSEVDGLYEDTHGFLSVPKFAELSIKNFTQSIYILCDGVKVYFWVDPNTNILLLKDLFGDNVETVNDIDPMTDELPELDTEISIQARNIVQYFQNKIVGCPTLGSAGIQLVIRGSPFESEFRNKLALDSLAGTTQASSGPSYTDYLTNLHKAVSVKIDSDKSSNKVRKSVNISDQHNESFVQRLMHF